MIYKGYEVVAGLEIHTELKTRTKAFCSCSAEYGGEPNGAVCPICLGMPGSMPSLNREAVRLGVVAGLSLNCKIEEVSAFDRKHYFYPDLPKGYQITQYYNPLCRGGFLTVGNKSFGIERIHLEEDAGKLSEDNGTVYADYNRCGVPLIEIVTYPDFRSAEEVTAFAEELRRTLLFAGVSDCKMNEGSMRCDLNVSVRPVGETVLGTRCEIKNINSIQFLGKALEGEAKRQIDIILSGGTVKCETRRFAENTGETERMRDKETPLDYRYMREPDLLPLKTDEAYVSSVRGNMRMSYREYVGLLTEKGIRQDTAELICSFPESAEFFKAVLEAEAPADSSSSLYVSEVLPSFGKKGITPEILANSAKLYSEGRVNIVTARRLLVLSAERGESPESIAQTDGLMMISDKNEILSLIESAASELPKAVENIKQGKAAAVNVIVGAVMRKTGGRADPEVLNREAKNYFKDFLTE